MEEEKLQISEKSVYEYPTLLRRIQSIFIDTLLIVALMAIATLILDSTHQTPDWVKALIFFGLFGIYEPFCMAFGCTLGNYVIGIRVRNNNDETKRINIIKSYIRYLVKLFLGWISFITISFNPRKRAIHDFAANSIMIEYND